MVKKSRLGCVDGAVECYRVRHWQPRDQGMLYIANTRFNDANGLSCLKIRLASESTNNLADAISMARAPRDEMNYYVVDLM